MTREASRKPAAPGAIHTGGREVGSAIAWTLGRFFSGKPVWHGALWPHIADLTRAQALWRPAPRRHCVWEIVRHVIFWRYWLTEHAAGRRIPDWRARNWTLPRRTDAAAWRVELRRLRASQRSLETLFRSTPNSTLLRNWRGGLGLPWLGVLAHDSYHTGQIAALRALMGLKPVI